MDGPRKPLSKRGFRIETIGTPYRSKYQCCEDSGFLEWGAIAMAVARYSSLKALEFLGRPSGI